MAARAERNFNAVAEIEGLGQKTASTVAEDPCRGSREREWRTGAGALAVPRSGSAAAQALAVRVVPGLAGGAVSLPVHHRGAGGLEARLISTGVFSEGRSDRSAMMAASPPIGPGGSPGRRLFRRSISVVTSSAIRNALAYVDATARRFARRPDCCFCAPFTRPALPKVDGAKTRSGVGRTRR